MMTTITRDVAVVLARLPGRLSGRRLPYRTDGQWHWIQVGPHRIEVSLTQTPATPADLDALPMDVADAAREALRLDTPRPRWERRYEEDHTWQAFWAPARRRLHDLLGEHYPGIWELDT